MYAFSWALLLLNRIPVINKLVKWLIKSYGRSSLWTLLVLIRKVFIVINAIIGVYAVFKLMGSSPQTWTALFTTMGYNYIEILSNFIRRLFNWIFELFDYKIVPSLNNKPSIFGGTGSPINGPGWFTKPVHNNGIMDVFDNFNTFKGYNPSPFQNNNYLSGDWNIWLWVIGGLTIITLSLAAIMYISSTIPQP